MTSTSELPVLALTPGEPAGIGIDICLELVRQPPAARLVFFADPQLALDRARQLDIDITINPIASPADINSRFKPGMFNLVPIALGTASRPGQLDRHNAAYVLESLRLAASACQQGYCDALVTAPVHKGIINDAGFSFSGHTEFLAELTGGYPVMMLACPGLRVALATTHLPLTEVSQAISIDSLTQIINIIDHDLKTRFRISDPAIYVCGLNPHAGENGHLGREEIDTIIPALRQCRSSGINVHGPLPADTIFTPGYLDAADVILAMYHDQGLPVLKHMGFGKAVNITLGLPLVRTSVDHGTALELAGTGRASARSLQMAVTAALDMLDS